jgi:hypothetical protein
MATTKPNVAAGDYAGASIITNLIAAIKTEFTRRNNPYNSTGLKAAGETLTSTVTDGEFID